MDAYTLGIIFQQLLQHAGVRATVVLAVLLGCAWMVWKALNGAVATFREIMAGRDAQLSAVLSQQMDANRQMLAQMVEDNKTRAALDTANVRVLEATAHQMAAITDELRRFRDEAGAKNNAILQEINDLKVEVARRGPQPAAVVDK